MHRRSDISAHSSTVAFGPARALTSHLRRHYEIRYRGRYPLAHIVFAVDMALVALALTLIGVNVYLATAPQPISGVRLVVSTPPIESAAPLALEATIISNDQDRREQVTLVWDLPVGSEILSASPALNAQGQALLGSLKPGQTLNARLVARLFPLTRDVRLGFRIQDLHGSKTEELAGEVVRPVIASGLKIESPLPITDPQTKLTSHATIPFLIKNTTHLPIDDIDLFFEGGATNFFGLTHLPLATLAPFSSRVMLVDPHGSKFIRLRVTSRGSILVAQPHTLSYTQAPSPLDQLSLAPSTPGQLAELELQSREPVQLFIAHPLLKDTPDHWQMSQTLVGKHHLTFALEPYFDQSLDHWLAVPFFSDGNQLTIGPGSEQVVTTPFEVAAAARFYTSSGDQVGVGPIPPQVGQVTKYWITWKLAATKSDLSNLNVQATLPPGVALTGRTALLQDGDLTAQGNEVVWHIPYVEASASGATASFEVALTPTRVMKGRIIKLLGSTSATAAETHNQVLLQANAPALDTNLIGDPKAEGQGIVR